MATSSQRIKCYSTVTDYETSDPELQAIRRSNGRFPTSEATAKNIQ